MDTFRPVTASIDFSAYPLLDVNEYHKSLKTVYSLLASSTIPHRAWDAASHELACLHALGSVGFQAFFDSTSGQHLTKGLCIMAKKTTTTKDFSWNGFININLSKADAPAFYQWVEDNETQLDELLQTCLESGHKLKISWDSKSNCFLAMLLGSGDDNPNSGYGMSSRAAGVQEALWMCLYKHHVITGTDWTSYTDSKNGFAWG